MSGLTIQGAYGRDYKTGEDMARDLIGGRDFRGTNPALGLMGTIFSIRDLSSIGVTDLSLRFNRDRSVVAARYESGGIQLKDKDGEWVTVNPEPKTVEPGDYCRGCGVSSGECPDLSCVELHHDSVVEAFCSRCGDCREVEPDARDYSCHTPGCSGKVTSPFELLM